MNNKNETLAQIIALTSQHKISISEIENAMSAKPEKSGNGIAMKIFGTLGGVFILAGISAYVGMFWGEMNSAARVIITLGSGFVAYILGIIFSRDTRYLTAVAPLLFIAALLESGGLFVLIDEYFNNNTNNWRLACLIVFGLMSMQQGLTFVSMRIPILLFTTLWFSSSFLWVSFDMLGVSEKLNAIIIGSSLLTIAYGIRSSIYQRTLQFAYLFGSIMFLGGAWDLLDNSPLYLALTCFMVYVSIFAHSTTLLVISVLAMLSYIGYFTTEHFMNSASWPVVLIVLGVLFIIIGAGAVRIKKKYI